MLFRSTRIFALVWLSIGLGLAGYYGLQWRQLPDWSEAEIAQSTELNLELDLKRMGPHLRPEGQKLNELRTLIRREIETELQHEQRAVQRGFFGGLLALCLGLGTLWLTRAR